MRSALAVLLACAVAGNFAAIVDFYDKGDESECAKGTRCIPAHLCPGATQPFAPSGLDEGVSSGLDLDQDLMRRPERCSPELPGSRVCCWSPANLPNLSRLRPVRQASASPSQRACEEYRRLRPRKRRSPQQGRPAGFVVGGVKAQQSEFPYMVAIGYVRGRSNVSTNLQWHCGGSLISDRYVLTAAHCITDAQRRNLRPVALRTGVNNLAQGPQQPDDYSVESITLHPRHRPDRKYFDLALLRTDRPVLFSASEIPVCLVAPDNRIDANTPLIVAGWGATDPEGYEKSADLKTAQLREVVLEECRKLIKERTELPRGVDGSMLCAADPQGKADTCAGDSGGPLAVRGPQGDELVGVTSFGGLPCATTLPGVYARVQPELEWIESIVWS